MINKTYCNFGRESGMAVQMNPSTDSALANEHGKGQASLLFPKRTTPAAKADVVKMRTAMDAAASPDPHIRNLAVKAIRLLISQIPKDFKGLQVDSIMESASRLLWTDTGIVHSTAPSALDATLNFVRRVDASEDVAAGNASLSDMSGHISPCVARYGRAKVTKYQGMVDGAASQVARGKRLMAPFFRPLIFSHLGEMSPDAITTVEFITNQYKDSLKNKYFEDGISNKRRAALFRMRFKDALMCANANGFGATLAAAGKPRAGKNVASPFENGGLPPWEIDSIV